MKTDSHSRAPGRSVVVLSACRTKLNRISFFFSILCLKSSYLIPWNCDRNNISLWLPCQQHWFNQNSFFINLGDFYCHNLGGVIEGVLGWDPQIQTGRDRPHHLAGLWECDRINLPDLPIFIFLPLSFMPHGLQLIALTIAACFTFTSSPPLNHEPIYILHLLLEVSI